MPAQLIEETLRVWREAERLLDELPPQTPDHETMRHAVIRLRDTYTRLSTLTGTTASTISECRAVLEAVRDTISHVEAKTRLSAREATG